MAEDIALWLPAKQAPLKVGPAPRPVPGPGEVLIRARAVAINPIDWLMLTVGSLITPYLHYPAVLGSDVAGEVIEVGRGVSRFQVGDRVVGYAAGSDKTRNRPTEGAFRTSVILLEHMTARLPDALSFEAACVLPLGLSTASAALFQNDMLALRPPGTAGRNPAEALLIWGGSTSVGSNAIQLARAAGYEVVTTASPRNFDYVKRLGAQEAFDYHDPDVVSQVIKALRGRHFAGAVAIGAGSARACVDVAGACEGVRFVALATAPASFDRVPARRGRLAALAPAIAATVAGNLSLTLRARRKGVRTKFIWGSTPVSNDVGPMIFRDFLPAALQSGRFEAAPPAQIVGEGVAAIPAALDRKGRGVSATKLVVTL